MILKLLEQVCKSLEDRNIDYMLSGSLAMNTYTIPRMTRDIDIVINLRLEDVKKFTEIFEVGFYLNEEGIYKEIKRNGMFNAIDHESGVKLDFIIRKDDRYHINEFERRQKTNHFGFDAWVVSIEDLIIAKLSWIQQLQSDTQINDLKNLLKNQEADLNYVKLWCDKLQLKTFGLL